MKVTDIRIRIGKQTENIERLKAYADITFDESFVIHGLKIIDGQNGLLWQCHQEECQTESLRT